MGSASTTLRRFFILLWPFFAVSALPEQRSLAGPSPERLGEAEGFAFAVAADMRSYAGAGTYDTAQYFRGAVDSMTALGGIDFLVSPGDIDPVEGVEWTVRQVLGESFVWVPVVGNHELPGQGSEGSSGANMAMLRAYDQGTVNAGPTGCPETTFSFNYLNAHFAVLNEYCDSGGDTVTDGDVPDHLYNWLAADLAATTQPFLFVIGHEPAYPLPDAGNGRLRHETDSLNAHAANRDRFWLLLESEGVTAYLCGHTHNYSAARMAGVWQIDAGHARGLGDTGAPSTYVVIRVGSDSVRYETYRDDSAGGAYSLGSNGFLDAPYSILLPTLFRS